MLPDVHSLEVIFGDRLEKNVNLGRYTSARVGGQADYYLSVNSAEELADTVSKLWALRAPFVLLGGGSNILVSDFGVREVVIHNQAHQIRFDLISEPPTVWAESGANFGVIARQAAENDLAGLEWASGIPGTVGGAVVGNAGAYGSDVASNLLVAEILHCNQHITNQLSILDQKGASTDLEIMREEWPIERFEYGYRSSIIKRKLSMGQDDLIPPGQSRIIILAAQFHLERSKPDLIKEKMDKYLSDRRRTQPSGSSMGSMFKNPPGDHAGRLIEAAGLKGTRIGDVEINLKHANFFTNQGNATATDIYALLQLARQTVAEKFGVNLELEIGLIGVW